MKRRNFLKALILSPLAALIRPEAEQATRSLDWPGMPPFTQLWQQQEPPVATPAGVSATWINPDNLLIHADELEYDSFQATRIESSTIIGRNATVEVSIDGVAWHLISQR